MAFLLVCSLTLYWFSERSNRFALGVAAALGGVLLVENTVDVLHSERSFFGINRVLRMEQKGMITLLHGTTMHGAEFIDPARRDQPLTYYARSGPLGQALAQAGPRPRAALIGLGTGALACYRKPGDDWTFFEIDASVEKIARDTRFFHYLADCGGAKVKLGDGRLLLQTMPDRSYDMIVVDAFSSDAIPTHLMTREALALYLRKLKPKGIILFNLSNRYLETGAGAGQWHRQRGCCRAAPVLLSVHRRGKTGRRRFGLDGDRGQREGLWISWDTTSAGRRPARSRMPRPGRTTSPTSFA